jgi:acetoin:2,6-dichlorophenolindophenol oxidoreductase subunit alpha
MHPIKTHDLNKYDKNFLQEIYTTMKKIREFELKASELFRDNKVPGMIHLSIGQEGSATGSCHALRKDDYIISTHRGHGHCIAKGGNLNLMMSEICGKQTGTNGGRGGSMHIMDLNIGMLGANGIVGGGIPMATGVGYSIQLRKTDQVCMVYFGEGATSEGAFHESLNLASVWNLPVIFYCENNLYAELTHIKHHTKSPDIAKKALAYEMEGITVDGNDVLAVHEATTKAVSKARQGGGPTLIECKTYRWSGHFEGDMQSYRTKEELASWVALDPIASFREHLLDSGSFKVEELEKIDQEIGEKIAECEKFALESSLPDPNDLLNYVYQN